MARTMDELIAQVPDGEKIVFEPTVSADRAKDRFLSVMHDYKYKPHLMEWTDPFGGVGTPYPGSCFRAAVNLDAIEEYVLHYKGAPKGLVDFYSIALDMYVFSDRLISLFNEFDPASINSRPARVITRDGEIAYHAVQPARVIQAIDVEASRTSIQRVELIPGKFYQTQISFPDGPVFRQDIPADVHALKDWHFAYSWYWSIELLKEAKKRGIRGLYAEQLSTARRDRLNL